MSILAFYFFLITNEFIVKNSTHFINEILDVDLDDLFHMASFGVKSLFTNISLNKTIILYVEQCVRNNLIPHNLSIAQFKSVFEMSGKTLFFLFSTVSYIIRLLV